MILISLISLGEDMNPTLSLVDATTKGKLDVNLRHVVHVELKRSINERIKNGKTERTKKLHSISKSTKTPINQVSLFHGICAIKVVGNTGSL